MKRLDIPGLPANASAYELQDGSAYRIHLSLVTPVDQLATAEDVQVETRGYRIDKSGNLLVDDNQEPIMLPAQRARIPLGNVRAGTDSVRPGYIKQEMPTDEEALKNARKLKKLPATGELGDAVIVGDEYFTYTPGLYEQVRQSRVAGLDVPAVETLDSELVASLIP